MQNSFNQKIMNLLEQLTEAARTAPSRALAAARNSTAPIALAAIAAVGASGCGTIQEHGGLGHISGTMDTRPDCEPGEYKDSPVDGMDCQQNTFPDSGYTCYPSERDAPRCRY